MATGDTVEFERMTGNRMSDFEVASHVRMLMRTDLDHEFVCLAGRDRIMYLSQQLERLVGIAEQAINNPNGKAPQTVLKNAVAYHRQQPTKTSQGE